MSFNRARVIRGPNRTFRLSLGRGRILSAVDLAAYPPIKMRISETLFGQSNERGNGRRWEPSLGPITSPAAWVPAYRRSVRGQIDPIAPANSGTASFLPSYQDGMALKGVDVKVNNCARGSGSFLKHACGQTVAWTANTIFFQQRTGGAIVLAGDRGDKGTLLLGGGKLWRVTIGANRYMWFDDPTGITCYDPNSTVGVARKKVDYLVFDVPSTTTKKSGSAPPDWTSVNTVGGTLVDGGLTLTLVNATPSALYTTFQPFGRNDPEYDPVGWVAFTKEQAAADDRMQMRIINIRNGQSDAQGSAGAAQTSIQAWYQKCLENLIDDFTTGTDFIIKLGLSSDNPNDTLTGNAFRWDTLDAAWVAACASKVDNVRVHPGLNLHRLLGPDPGTYPEAGATYGVHLTDEVQDKVGVLEAKHTLALPMFAAL